MTAYFRSARGWLIAFSFGLLGVWAVSRESYVSPLDEHAYSDLMALHADDPSEWIEDYFLHDQLALFNLIMPPFSELRGQQGAPLVIPVSAEAFKTITAHLDTEDVYSAPVHRAVLNTDLKRRVIQIRSKSQPEHVIEWPMPSSFPTFFPPGMSPDRISIETILLAEENVEYYLYAKQQVEAYLLTQQSLEQEPGGFMMLMGEEENLRIHHLQWQSGQMLVEIRWPEEDFTNRIDLFVTGDLVSDGGVWQLIVEGLETSGTNALIWTNTHHKTFQALTAAWWSGRTDQQHDRTGLRVKRHAQPIGTYLLHRQRDRRICADIGGRRAG
jgi:hypothetical protein